MTKALYAGTFDPVHNGHLDITFRAAALFDEVVVAVAASSRAIFSLDERVALFAEAVKDHPNVSVQGYRVLTVDLAQSIGATVMIRSMRGGTDFDYEFDIALMNRKMAPQIESLYFMARLENLFISGTRIREVASLGYVVSDLVPENVAKALQSKFGQP